MIENEKLIEEAAKAMWAANDPEGWERATGAEQAEHLTLASAALAVFEKAHPPTDGEREALSEFLFTVYDHGTNPNALREADAILAFLASRRSVTMKPSAEDIRLASLAAVRKGARSDAEAVRNYREAERVIRAAIPHLRGIPEPQGEPSDAQVEAAISAHRDYPGDYIDRSSTDWNRDRMRAALRAASAVTEQGEGENHG